MSPLNVYYWILFWDYLFYKALKWINIKTLQCNSILIFRRSIVNVNPLPLQLALRLWRFNHWSILQRDFAYLMKGVLPQQSLFDVTNEGKSHLKHTKWSSNMFLWPSETHQRNSKNSCKKYKDTGRNRRNLCYLATRSRYVGMLSWGSLSLILRRSLHQSLPQSTQSSSIAT